MPRWELLCEGGTVEMVTKDKDEERAEVSYEKPQTTISSDTCEKKKERKD